MTAGDRPTERRHPRTVDLDMASSRRIVDLLLAEERLVAEAVLAAGDTIARVIDRVVVAFERGGRLIYVGAGTSGRLGVLDASECPPTFGTPPERVEAILAGGPGAVFRSREGMEDDEEAARDAVDARDVSESDVVVGIAASGSTPFVRSALARARARGAVAVLVCCAPPPDETAAICDEVVLVEVGPEALTGSTRLKAGSATKVVLNAITTGAMVRSGRAWGNLMVDLRATSAKLRDRGERIVLLAGAPDRAAARRAIDAAEGSVKTAVVMVRLGVGAEEARTRLEEAGGSVRAVAGDPPPVGIVSVLAVGLMSGTSLDGIDAALVRIEDPNRLVLLAFRTERYDEATREAIGRAIREGGARDLALLHADLGHRFADVAASLLETSGVAPGDVEIVGSHGQTVWHEPGRATLQLGDPAPIAERLGVPVVSDFRSRDVAAGGQGAPLVPIADVMLFGHPERGRTLLNLGGMANLTWVPRRGKAEGVVALDTGPGVAVVDAVARLVEPGLPFDVDGRLAAGGSAVDAVVDRALNHAFFAVAPPRSTGRETFGESFAEDLLESVRAARPGATGADAVATAVSLTVRSVAEAIRRWRPVGEAGDLLVSGGGARHPGILGGIRAALPGCPVRLFEETFFDGDAKEAAAFAYLAWLTRRGEPGNVPSATGAAGPRVLGRITPP